MTILFQESNQLTKAKPVSLLPLLVFLFIISYAMLTYLVVQQNATIASQRTLIHQLLGDSVQLSAMKGKAILAERDSQKSAPAATQSDTTQTPKPKPGVVQKAPATKPEARKENKKRALPEKPSKNTGVVIDARRVMFSL